MKVALVSMDHLTPSRDLRATTYADPTRHVDREIRRAETTIRRANKRLKALQEERARILSGAAPQVYFTADGRMKTVDEHTP